MNKHDKIVKGLECCIKQAENDIYCVQLDCPYYEPVRDGARLMCWTKLNRDALAFIKEKVKTKVVFKQYDGSIETECGNCGLYLDKAYSRCPKCQKELDWNDGQS